MFSTYRCVDVDDCSFVYLCDYLMFYLMSAKEEEGVLM